MIRTERDPAFWREVASHPLVAPHVLLGREFDVGAVAQHASVTPLAAQHGGFLFCKLDGLGFVYELHSLFTPEGWGREVHGAGKEALQHIFAQGASVIVTTQTEDGKAPPRSFGWREADNYRDTDIGNARCWFLTADAWRLSPGGRKCPH